MAMMLPAINLEPPSGLQTYPEPPLLTNRASRGTLTAQREDTVTLIATSPGVVAIDGARINWWNTQTRRLTTLTTEQLELTISGQLPPKPVSRTQMIERALYALAILIDCARPVEITAELAAPPTSRRDEQRALSVTQRLPHSDREPFT